MRKIRRRMPRAAALVAALAVLGAAMTAAIAGAADPPVTVRVGDLIITADGGLTPKKMSKTKLTPVAFEASGSIKTASGAHPPAVKEVIVEGDKNVAVDTTGFPVCKSGQLQSRDTASAEKVCKPAIIGEGTTNIEIAFPEQPPIPVKSKLLIFNGGTSGGVTTFFIHAYITVPTPAAVVTTVKIRKIHKGRFGTEAIASIPKIAGGSGSVTSFSLKIDKKYTYKGKKMSVIASKCTDGKILANATAKFTDGTKATAELIRTCTPKG